MPHNPRPGQDAAPAAQLDRPDATPLVVDLDGTLLRGDLLIETFAAEAAREPRRALRALSVLPKGKAALKACVAEEAPFDPSTLPYDPDVLALLKEAAAQGRPIYLASASNERQVEAVAAHLKLFTGWMGSTETCNLSRERKAALLVERFGEGGFDYIGNEQADLPVWSKARRCISVGAPASVRRKLEHISPDATHMPGPKPTLRTWIKLIRSHQWVKNTLVFTTVLTDRAFSIPELTAATMAFVAFCLAASSIYIVNDIVDLAADRGHPSKKRRPLACGQIALKPAMIVAALMFTGAIGVGAAVSLPFLGVLLTYLALTTAYSFNLKRKMLIDTIALAGLYAIRMVGGAVAMGVPLSHWILLFALFIFTSLALMKRFVEIATRADAGLPDPSNRNYKAGDMTVVTSLAAATGYNAVVIFGLYISSDTARELYTRPHLLWFITPLLLYWLGRMLIMAHRRTLQDDPVVFTLLDRNSRIVFLVSAIIVLLAA